MSALARRLIGALSVATVMAVSLPAVHAEAETGVHVGGIIASDATWTAADGPFLVDAPIQIADGATLRIDPGVYVEATPAFTAQAPMFGVAGTLDIAGTKSDPVVIDGGGSFGLAAGLSVNSSALIQISHADVSNFHSLIPATGNSQRADFDISDSVFSDLPYLSYFWYPYSYARVERNLFVNVGPLTFGTDQSAVATVEDNRFRGTSPDPYSGYRHALESWAAYGQPLQVHGNTFEPAAGQTYALKVVTDGAADATGNDWGTTSVGAAKARILDKEDDLNLPSVVPVAPLLDGPSTLTSDAQPTAPKATSALGGDSMASVSWKAPDIDGGASISGYAVTAAPGGMVAHVPATQTTATFTGLTNGTAYTFTVVATNAVGDSAASAPTNQITPAGVPVQMQSPRVAVRGNKVIVKWSAADPNGSQITRYKVDISVGRDKAISADARKTVFKNLRAGRYKVRISACNALGQGPYSAWAKFRIR